MGDHDGLERMITIAWNAQLLLGLAERCVRADPNLFPRSVVETVENFRQSDPDTSSYRIVLLIMITPFEKFSARRSPAQEKEAEMMPKPPPDAPVADQAPTADDLTGYDHEHLITYLRLLDAAAEGADWSEVARLVLHIDPFHEPERARRVFESHLARARWMTENGYRDLLKGSDP
jgi:Uncharacterized conserved protein (DUF2285)